MRTDAPARKRKRGRRPAQASVSRTRARTRARPRARTAQKHSAPSGVSEVLYAACKHAHTCTRAFVGARAHGRASTAGHRAWRAKVRAFVTEHITPYVAEWDEAQGFPRDLHTKAAAAVSG